MKDFQLSTPVQKEDNFPNKNDMKDALLDRWITDYAQVSELSTRLNYQDLYYQIILFQLSVCLSLNITAKRGLFIQTLETPNPNCLKFIPGCEVIPEGTIDFPNIKAAKEAPLAK